MKIFAFSRKKSLFSGKNIGNRVRLTLSSSASTCEKSVLYVRSRVILGVTPYLTSRPISPDVLLSPSKVLSVIPKGFIPKFLEGWISLKPVSVPALEILSNRSCRWRGDQYTSSVFLRIRRRKLIPQFCCLSFMSKRRVVKGMAISTIHPLLKILVFRCTIPSQLALYPAPSLVIYRSLIAPLTLKRKMKALSRS